MFTSRAEYRLQLRADNADLRLTEKGIALGLISSERQAVFRDRQQRLAHGRACLDALSTTPRELQAHGISINQDGVRRTAFEMLRYPDVTLERLTGLWPQVRDLPPDVVEHLETEGRYAGYMARQQTDIDAYRKEESLKLPDDLDYTTIRGLSAEVQSKLMQVRPATLGAASRIPGMTPAALTRLVAYIRKVKKERRLNERV